MNICGTIVIKTTDGTFYKGSVLCSDVFEDNSEFKACLIVDFETKLDDNFFFDNQNIDYVVFTIDMLQSIMYGYLNVERHDDGSIDESLNDVMFEEEYRNGTVSRFWIFCQNPSSIQLLNCNLQSILETSCKIHDYEIHKDLFS